jgi:hypothetical protein
VLFGVLAAIHCQKPENLNPARLPETVSDVAEINRHGGLPS